MSLVVYALLFLVSVALGSCVFFTAKLVSMLTGLSSHFWKPVLLTLSFLAWSSLAVFVSILTGVRDSPADGVALIAIPGFVALLSAISFLPLWILRPSHQESKA
jgi:hypothetical protein